METWDLIRDFGHLFNYTYQTMLIKSDDYSPWLMWTRDMTMLRFNDKGPLLEVVLRNT